MAATALRQFEPARLARFLAETSGADDVLIGEPELLAGGAIQQNWGFRARFIGGRLAGAHDLVLRTDAPTGVPSSLGRIEEFSVLNAVYRAGVTVPEPLCASDSSEIIGQPFFVMRRLRGTAQGREITTNPALEPELPRIASRVAGELARIQTIGPPRDDLAFLPTIDARAHIAAFRTYLDAHPRPRPVLEWAIHWLETHLPDPLPLVLCHRDFRTGNYLLEIDSGGAELTGILDWEFAGWGDPDEDIGWFCCKGWRFARLDREAGGIADRAVFYAAYEAASGRRLDPERVQFWEVLANVRWAVIALQQSDRVLKGGATDLATAIIGRRATECDLELLLLLDPDGSPVKRPRASRLQSSEQDSRAPDCLRDLPSGRELLALGRSLLLDELVPLLPAERHREARLVATAMAIARREVLAGDDLAREIRAELQTSYGATAPHPHLHPACGERVAESEPRTGDGIVSFDEMLARFAADLRNGAFELCRAREEGARAILWRLTILKLREGNPEFLAANGFGE